MFWKNVPFLKTYIDIYKILEINFEDTTAFTIEITHIILWK